MDKINSPFKFLDVYTRDDHNIFFGREREIEELYRRVFESKILLVYGLSGTGKSSLIQCGLANKFDETDWFPVNIRRGKNIPESLWQALSEVAHTPLKEEGLEPHHFIKAVKSLYLDYYKPVFFVFDQFEELFIFGNAAEKSAFIEVVKALVDSDLQCRYIFVLREEYLAGVTEFEKIIPDILANRMRIEKMSPASARLAIQGPCRTLGIPVEESFADGLLERLSPEDSDIELTYLQVFLDKIYRKALHEYGQKSLKFTLNLLQGTGNVSDILGSFLDEQIEQFHEPDAALVVLKSFVSMKGTRRQMSMEEVRSFSNTLGKPLHGTVLVDMIQKLVQLRILRDKDQNNRYELRHDALAAVIYEKISIYEKDLIEIRQFLENSLMMYDKRERLLTEEDLRYIAPYEGKLYVNKEVGDLIAKSKKELRKRRQKLRNIKATAGGFLIILLSVFTIWALTEKNKANRLYLITRAVTLNYFSKEVVESNPNIALRLAEYAFSLDPGNHNIWNNIHNIYYNNSFYLKQNLFTEGHVIADISVDRKKLLVLHGNKMLLTDFEGNKLAGFSAHTNQVITACFSPDGDRILSGSYDRTARLWNVNGDLLQTYRGHNAEVGNVAFSPDGKTMLSSSWDRVSHIWDTDASKVRVLQGYYLVSFSPDGQSLLGFRDNIPYLCDSDGNLIQTYEGHQALITSLAFAPDGNTILSGSADMTVRHWHVNGELLNVLKGHTNPVTAIAYSPEGNSFAGASKGNIFLWFENGMLQRHFRISEDIGLLKFFNEEQLVIAASKSDIVFLNHSGKLKNIIDGPENPVRFITFSPDSRYMLAASDLEVRLWDFETHQSPGFQLSNIDGFKLLTGCFVDNEHILFACDDSYIRLLDIKGNEKYKWRTNLATFIAVSPDGQYFVTNSSGGEALLFDISGKHLLTLEGHSGRIIALAFSPDGKMLLTGSMDHTARLWDIGGNQLAELAGHSGPVNAVAFGIDNQIVVTGSAGRIEVYAEVRGYSRFLGHYTSDDYTLRKWNIQGKQLQVHQITYPDIISITIPNGLDFVIAEYGINNVRLLRFSGEELQSLPGNGGNITAAAVSADGKILATAGNDIMVWENVQAYEDFSRDNRYASLSVSDKLHYNIIDHKAVLQFNDPDNLVEAAGYYYNAYIKKGIPQGLEDLKYSINLYHKAVSESYNAGIIIHLIQLYYELGEMTGTKNHIKATQELTESILKANHPDDLMEAAMVFFSLSRRTDAQHERLRHLKQAVRFYEKIDPVILKEKLAIDASTAYNDLALQLLFSGKHQKAAGYAEKANLLKSDVALSACLAICYIMNEKPELAKEIFDHYEPDVLERVMLKEELLTIIDGVRASGIRHPEIEKLMYYLYERDLGI